MTNLMALEMDVDSRDAGNTGNTGGLQRTSGLQSHSLSERGYINKHKYTS